MHTENLAHTQAYMNDRVGAEAVSIEARLSAKAGRFSGENICMCSWKQPEKERERDDGGYFVCLHSTYISRKYRCMCCVCVRERESVMDENARTATTWTQYVPLGCDLHGCVHVL